jgi:tetratricopeptide (TPR) repeat protein
MTLVGQPPASPALKQSLALLAAGKEADGEAIVKKAALKAKARHGSGSHPLALAYGDLARFHFRTADYERAAKEFQHASRGPMPSEKQERQDRLAFLFGFGAALGELRRLDEAEKVLRQCLAYARNVDGPQSASAYVALVPLADVLLKAGKTAEATKLAFEAYNALWKLGDPRFIAAVGTRAEALKAAGRSDNPFLDLTDLPNDMVSAAVSNTLERAGKGDAKNVRALLADLLKFVDKKFGDGHEATCDTLAAIAHHEAAQGEKADARVRTSAVRRSVWSFAVRRMPGGLLDNLDVAFEAGGKLHLAPHLSREPSPSEAAEIETVLNSAVDELYGRPTVKA